MSDELRRCSKCSLPQPESEFYVNGRFADGSIKRRPDCKNCVRERTRAHNNTETWARAHAKKRYGITLEEAEVLWYADCCFLCGSADPGDKRGKFHIDHCHLTGTVRRPLCSRCNIGIGWFKDNPDVLRKAADYIEEFRCPSH